MVVMQRSSVPENIDAIRDFRRAAFSLENIDHYIRLARATPIEVFRRTLAPDAASTSGAGMKLAPTKPRADPVFPPPGGSNEGSGGNPPLPFQRCGRR
jgi:hypothetical protein